MPTVLFGPGGVGKSTIAAGIAVTWETGAEVIQTLTTPTPGRVLIIDWEANRD